MTHVYLKGLFVVGQDACVCVVLRARVYLKGASEWARCLRSCHLAHTIPYYVHQWWLRTSCKDVNARRQKLYAQWTEALTV